MNEKLKAVGTYLASLANLSDHLDIPEAQKSIRENIYFRGPNVYILFFAIIIASVGLNVNSIPVIIGAMLVSPLMGPIMGVGMGLGTNDTRLALDALKNWGVMVVISIIASTLYFLLSPLSLDKPTELLARTNPTVYDVMIALFGGLAGILETSRKERGTVISGVAIATALMPPLCTAGYGIANLNATYTFGALYLFLINSVLIALATYVAVRFLHYPKFDEAGTNTKRKNLSITILLLCIVVPSVLSAIKVVKENNFEIKATDFVEKHRFIGSTYIYDYKINSSATPASIEFYLAGEKLEESAREAFVLEALKAGFHEDQIILKDDATSDIREKLSDEELLRQLLQSKDDQIEAYRQIISNLQIQLEEAQQALLSTDTLALEETEVQP